MVEWQTLSIPLAGGVDTKTDEALVETTKVLELENGVFSVKDRRNKRTSISKRNGYRNIAGGIDALATVNNQILGFSGVRTKAFSTARQQFIDANIAEVLTVSQKDLNRPAGITDAPDTVVTNGIRADVSISNGVSVFRLVDTTDDTIIRTVTGNTTSINHKVFACGQFIFLTFVEPATTQLKWQRYDTLNPNGSTLISTVTSSLVSNFYDISGDSQKIVLVYEEAGGLIVTYYTRSGNQGSPVINGLPAPVTVPIAASSTWICVRYLEDTVNGDLVFIGHIEAQLDIVFDVLREDFTVFAGPTTFYTGDAVSDPVRALTICWDGADTVYVFCDIAAVAAIAGDVGCGAVDLTGSATESLKVNWSVGTYLCAKAFYINAQAHVPVFRRTSNNLQNTVYVLHTSTFPQITKRYEAAKINYSVSGFRNAYISQNDGATDLTILKESQIVGTQVHFATCVVTKLVGTQTGFDTLTGTQLVTLETNASDSHYTAVLGKSLFMTGGFLRQWDGTNWTENGFHYFPNLIGITQSAGTGSIGVGTYLYTAIYTWQNQRGEVERSAPAIPLSIVVAAANSSVDVTVDYLNLTQKTNGGTVTIELYRSTANAPANSTLYKTTQTPNNEDLTSATITNSNSDAALVLNEPLYTTGNVLENISPNAGTIVENYKNRLVTKDPSDENLTWISKEYEVGRTVEFSDVLTFRTSDIGGRITGYKQLDDKLLIFKKNLIFVTSGDGPNNTGTEFGLFPPEIVASDTGCNNASSIVLTPVGVMFKSAKGFYLMNRSLQLEYIGQDVESFNFQDVTAATMVEDRNQVRFLTSSGLTLVYDYFYRQWSTFTNHEGLDAIMCGSVYSYLRTNGDVWNETEGLYRDDQTAISLKIKTPWIKLMQSKSQAVPLGPQSFFRVRRFALLGRLASKHTLQIGVSYDYRPDVQQTYYFNTEQRLSIPAGQYGNDAYYGATSPYGGDLGNDTVYQFRARTARQKCESFQLIIQDIAQPFYGESYGITDLSIEVGLKKGINKMGVNKTVQGS
jgi:hypothetical protein